MCLGGVLYCTGLNPNRPNPAKKSEPVPLIATYGIVKIIDYVAEVTVIQRFENRESNPLEVVYQFPLRDGVTVTSFNAELDGMKVNGRIEEKEKAVNIYDDAIAEGHGAYLLEQNESEGFSASIGNLPPGKEVKITLVFTMEIDFEESGKLRITLPANYLPSEGVKTPKFPTPIHKDILYEKECPTGLTMDITFFMSSKIVNLRCDTHPSAEATITSGNDKTAKIHLPTSDTPLMKDMVILCELEEPHIPCARVEKDKHGNRVAMVSFYPKLHDKEIFSEIIFVVDRSGSMHGTKMERVKDTMQIFMRSLPPGTLFNIVSFGTSFSSLFQGSDEYSDSSLKIASDHISKMTSNMGGTNILTPLKHIFMAPPIPGVPRQIFLLTDGEVSNTQQCIDEVRIHAESTRLFCFGIGNGASHHLVSGMAKAGGGSYEMIGDYENSDTKVLRQLTRALQPAITDIKIEWSDAIRAQAPARIPPVFSGSRLIVFGFLKDDVQETNLPIRLKAKTGEDDIEHVVYLDTKAIEEGELASKLAAKAMIRSLEEATSYLHNANGSIKSGVTGDEIRKEIIKLSLDSGVLSQYTAFVAVEEREGATPGEMKLRKIKVGVENSPKQLLDHKRMVRTPNPRGLVKKERSPLFSLQQRSSCLSIGAQDQMESPPPQMISPPPPQMASPPPQMASLSRSALPFSVPPSAPVRSKKMMKPTTSSAPLPARDEPNKTMRDIILKQGAMGNWELADLLSVITQIKFDDNATLIALGIPQDKLAAAKTLLATALAIVYLEVKFPEADDKTSWNLVVRKARTWLAKQNIGVDVKWEDEARKLIK